MDFDVFISYHTKSSTHITEAVCNALESKKIKCWYAPRNIAGSYAKSIVDAIGKCKIFLLILNKEASYSEDVLNEINLAVERVRKGDEIAIIPFHISEEDISPDAKYYLGRIHWVDAINPPMEKRINELVSRIAYILNKNIDSNFETSNVEFTLKSNYPASVCNFVGRKNELAELEENLNKYGKVFIQGMGGIGKSELVRKYINDYKEEYNTIIFAVYENNLIDTINKEEYFKINNFTKKIDENGKPEDREIYFARKFDKIKELANEKTLIIIDNFDVEDDENLKDVLTGSYHLIVTTRNDFKKYKFPVMHIEPMTDIEELLDLFKENYMIRIKDEDIEAIKDIIELIGRHTLTVQLLASVMQEMRIKPQKMFENLKNHGINNEIQGEVNHGMQDYESIYQCLKVLFRVSDLKEEEKNILKLLTVFPISGVEFDKFMELCEIDSGLVINKLIKKSFILHNYEMDSITLHPLIANLIEQEISLKIEDVRTLIHNIGNKYGENILMSEKESCATVGFTLWQKFENFDKDSALDFSNIAIILLKVNRVQNSNISEAILKRACELYEQDKDKYIIELAKVYRYCEHLYDSEKIQKDGHPNFFMKIVNLLKGKEEYKEKYAEALKGVAFRYISEEKDPEKAIKYLDEAYEIYKGFGNLYEFGIGSCYLAYARIFDLRKEYEKALEYVNKCYDIFMKVYGIENNDVSEAIRIKAYIYRNLKNYKEAIRYLEKTLQIRDKYCDKKGSGTLKVKEQLIDVYMLNGEYEKAKKELEELYNTLEENYINSEKRLLKIQEKIEICSKELSK